jgi:4-hydroxy-tetrahydrodipicolinate reductase
MADMRLIVAGAGGRMGRTLIRAIAETGGVALAGALEAPTSDLLGQDSGVLAGLPPNRVNVISEVRPGTLAADAILDFTVPAATVRLAALVKQVAKSLDDDFDIEILEMHHKAKIDAPSGTAFLLGQAAAEGRAVNLDARSVRSRDGHTGARHSGDIGFATLRGGTVTGDHTVIFAGPYERLELTHKSEDRMIFARGALKAAMWAHGRKPGHYSMADVLALKPSQ